MHFERVLRQWWAKFSSFEQLVLVLVFLITKLPSYSVVVGCFFKNYPKYQGPIQLPAVPVVSLLSTGTTVTSSFIILQFHIIWYLVLFMFTPISNWTLFLFLMYIIFIISCSPSWVHEFVQTLKIKQTRMNLGCGMADSREGQVTECLAMLRMGRLLSLFVI